MLRQMLGHLDAAAVHRAVLVNLLAVGAHYETGEAQNLATA